MLISMRPDGRARQGHRCRPRVEVQLPLVPRALWSGREIVVSWVGQLVENRPVPLHPVAMSGADAKATGPIIACTIWETERQAIAYEAGGTAKEVVGKVKGFFAGPPTLRSYRVRR
jgi:hypothetical protein